MFALFYLEAKTVHKSLHRQEVEDFAQGQIVLKARTMRKICKKYTIFLAWHAICIYYKVVKV